MNERWQLPAEQSRACALSHLVSEPRREMLQETQREGVETSKQTDAERSKGQGARVEKRARAEEAGAKGDARQSSGPALGRRSRPR